MLSPIKPTSLKNCGLRMARFGTTRSWFAERHWEPQETIAIRAPRMPTHSLVLAVMMSLTAMAAMTAYLAAEVLTVFQAAQERTFTFFPQVTAMIRSTIMAMPASIRYVSMVIMSNKFALAGPAQLAKTSSSALAEAVTHCSFAGRWRLHQPILLSVLTLAQAA